ncbi:MAG: enolase C-terminal domain-like protein [Geodermatophilaceae bacterium]
MSPDDGAVRDVAVSAYRVPTITPEADGTASWDATEVVVVQVRAAGATGLGWSYCPVAAAGVIDALLAPIVLKSNAYDVPRTWTQMIAAVRNAGRPGLVSMAVSAVDTALWDLKARLLGLPLHVLLGQVRDEVPVYGSGGFVSQTDAELVAQLLGWVDDLGIPRVKIKVGEGWGSQPARDLARTRLARQTIGDDVELFVDANGGYSPGQARRLGRAYDDS